MSISFTWDNPWETIPTDQIPRGDIRNHIGQIKVGTRERMEVEHEWGPNSTIDTGGHIRGGTGVAARGNAVPATNLKSGELCVVDTGGGDTQLWLYGDIGSGLQWNLISTKDHAQLINRAVGDPHPIYVLKAGENITPNIFQMGGKILRMSVAAGAPNRAFGGFLLYDHATKAHPSLGSIGAIGANTILQAKLKTTIDTFSGNISPNSGVVVRGTAGVITFFPEITIQNSGGVVEDIFVGITLTPNLPIIGSYVALYNATANFRAYQIRMRTAQP